MNGDNGGEWGQNFFCVCDGFFDEICEKVKERNVFDLKTIPNSSTEDEKTCFKRTRTFFVAREVERRNFKKNYHKVTST